MVALRNHGAVGQAGMPPIRSPATLGYFRPASASRVRMLFVAADDPALESVVVEVEFGAVVIDLNGLSLGAFKIGAPPSRPIRLANDYTHYPRRRRLVIPERWRSAFWRVAATLASAAAFDSVTRLAAGGTTDFTGLKNAGAHNCPAAEIR